MLENIKDTPTKSLSETNTILSSTVNEFLCNVGGGLHRLAWESNGIVGLTCPIEEEEKSESNKKVEIFIQIPLVDILSANKPGIAVIESLNRILDSHSSTPCFLFVRRVIQSNTSKW